MAPQRIAIVCEPEPTAPIVALPTTESPRVFYRYDAFAEQLRRSGTFQVDVVEDLLDRVPEQTLVLLHGSPRTGPTHPGRIVLINSERPPAVLRTLEAWKLGGAIDSLRYLDWLEHPERETGGGLFGLRTAAARMGATCFESKVFATPTYCSLRSDRCRDLPELVLAYFDALTAEG